MDRVHLAMVSSMLTVMTIFGAMGASGMAPAAPPIGRLLKVPKVYNALITSDIPLLPSRAETAATAAVGPVLLYSTQLPVLLQPQAQGATPQHHLDKLAQVQNQLQREDVDQRQIQLPRCCIPQLIPVAVQPVGLQQLAVQQQLFPEQLPVKPLFQERAPIQQPYPVKQHAQQQLHSERQLPIQPQQPLYPERQLPVQQLFPERQQLSGSRRQPLQVESVPVQHISTEQLPRQHYNVPYQKSRPFLQQQYPAQIDVQQRKIQRPKQLQLQLQQQKQFDNQQKEVQDSSYLPMPEMSSYQPPPSVHIDDIKNNKPSNAAIPDVPPPPLPVGKRLQPYSYNSPGLSPPPATSHHIPYV